MKKKRKLEIDERPQCEYCCDWGPKAVYIYLKKKKLEKTFSLSTQSKKKNDFIYPYEQAVFNNTKHEGDGKSWMQEFLSKYKGEYIFRNITWHKFGQWFVLNNGSMKISFLAESALKVFILGVRAGSALWGEQIHELCKLKRIMIRKSFNQKRNSISLSEKLKRGGGQTKE